LEITIIVTYSGNGVYFGNVSVPNTTQDTFFIVRYYDTSLLVPTPAPTQPSTQSPTSPAAPTPSSLTPPSAPLTIQQELNNGFANITTTIFTGAEF